MQVVNVANIFYMHLVLLQVPRSATYMDAQMVLLKAKYGIYV